MKLTGRILALSVAASAATTLALIIVFVIQKNAMTAHVREGLNELAAKECSAIAKDVYRMIDTRNETVKRQVRSDLNVARNVMDNAGEVAFANETVSWQAINEYTKGSRPLTLPKMQVGGEWLGQNSSMNARSLIVDEVQDLVGGTCTVFQRMNEAGDMLRVSTNVEKLDGSRAIGTYIPAVNPDGTPNPVISTVMRGETYNGRAYVVNAWYVTAYEPIFDDNRRVVGILYVGVKQEDSQELRQAIMEVVVGKTGYVYIVGGKGEQRGRYIVSAKGKQDGENIWEVEDANGDKIIQHIVGEALATDGQAVRFVRYPWKNAEDEQARMKLAAVSYFEPWDWVIGVGAYEDDFQDAANAMVRDMNASFMWFLAAATLAMGGVFVVSAAQAKRIVKPLRRAVQMMKDVATGEGDLSKRLPMRAINCSKMKKCGKQDCPEFGKDATCWDTVGSNASGEILCPSVLNGKYKSCHECQVMKSAVRDETDELCVWFNTFVARLSHMVHKIFSNAETLSNASTQLTDTANGLASGADDTTRRSSTVASAAEEMSANMGNMATATEHMAENVKTVASSVEEMTASISEIAKNAEQAAQVADNAAVLAESSNTAIQQLGDAADEIGKVIVVIQDIAEQTNLLALNATIEALRAGDAGKGFAVVATEVKELAKQTAEATEDIRQRIEGIQGSTTEAVQSIGKITEVIGQVNEVSRTIASSVEEQSITTQEIARNVTQTSDTVATVTTGVSETAAASLEITRNITGVDQAARQTADGASHAQSAGKKLSDLSQQLQSLVGQFKY